MSDINIGKIIETLNNKVDRDFGNIPANNDVVIEYQEPTAENNYTWYRLYASGWVEQGGAVSGWNARENFGLITLPIIMLDTNYIVIITAKSNRGTNIDWNFTGGATPKTTSSFSYSVYGLGTSDIAIGMSWQVSGKADMTGHSIPSIYMAKEEFAHRVIAFQKPTAANNYTWYRKYADGWVEQGGRAVLPRHTVTNTVVSVSVALPIQMAYSGYQAGYTRDGDPGNVITYMMYTDSSSTTTLLCKAFSQNETLGNQNIFWEVKGMAA